MGLRVLIESEDDLELAGEAENGRAAIELARARPDVILMDIRMPIMDGIAALRVLTADPALDAVRVIMLTTFETGRVRLRRPAGRGRGIPDQGQRAGRHAAGDPAGRGGGVAAVALGDQAGDRLASPRDRRSASPTRSSRN